MVLLGTLNSIKGYKGTPSFKLVTDWFSLSPDPRLYRAVAGMAEAAKSAHSNACPQATLLHIIPLSIQLFRVNCLKGNCFGSPGVSRIKRVKSGKWQVTSAALSCLSPVGLIAANATEWNQIGSANSSIRVTALAFPSCLPQGKSAQPGTEVVHHHLCTITRKPALAQHLEE